MAEKLGSDRRRSGFAILHTPPPADAGDDGSTFRAKVSNAFGDDTSSAATLTVLGNLPPTPTINLPISGSSYTFDQTINFSGVGTDPEDGNLPASAFTWRVDFHHGSHMHPHLADTTNITSESFQTNFNEVEDRRFLSGPSDGLRTLRRQRRLRSSISSRRWRRSSSHRNRVDSP